MASKAPEAREHAPAAPYIVLVGLDLSEPGGRAWRFAFDLAALKGDDSEVHAVIVGTRALAPRVRDLATPGVSTGLRADGAAPLPGLDPTGVPTPAHPGEPPPGLPTRELGDVVICPAHTADLSEAIVHGVLHLVGFDHETDDGQMLELQRQLLALGPPAVP